MTLDQLLRMKGPNDKAALIADPLSQRYGLARALEFKPTNNHFMHEITQVAEYGTADIRRINQGATMADPETRQFTTRALYLETRLRIDELLLKTEDDPMRFQQERWMMTVKGMGKGISRRLQYDNAPTETADPDGMQGLAARFNSTSLENVWDAGGTSSGSLTSVYLMETSPLGFYGLYLKNVGDGVGFNSEFKGLQTVYKDNKEFDAYTTKITGSLGLGIGDNRCIQRVCNIDTSATGTRKLTESSVLDLLIYAINELPEGRESGNRVFLLVNRQTMAQLEISLKNSTNVNFTPVDWLGGRQTLTVSNVPVIHDAGILNTESRVVA